MAENKDTVPTQVSDPTAVSGSSAHEPDAAHDSHHHEVGVEPESINAFLIMGIVFATSLVVVVLILVGFTITTSYSQINEAAMVAEAEYPEVREVRAEAISEMKKTGVVDEENGIYRISVDEAIDLMVKMQYENPEGAFTEEFTLTAP